MLAKPDPHPRSFYESSAARVAPQLLGQLLLRRIPGGFAGGIIVEVEAYLHDDPACHAFRGETARNRSMFGPPGHAYVYFIYGNHWCFNAVCGPRGTGEAVLVRAIDPRFGLEWMRRRRAVRRDRDLTSGPGKCCAALGIDRAFDAADLCDAASPIFIARNTERADSMSALGPVAAGRRIGLTKATELPLRFRLAGSPFVSRKS